ncbi:MAG: hypothetical protein JWO30_2557 [Fibrobacteres bacterium]|nr:hypothetical protein [Fibrobacterota bacterium]
MLPDSVMFSARLIFGLCSLALVGVILVMIRRNAIREKYALLWLPLGGGFLIMSFFPDLLLDFSARVHLHYMTVVVLGIIIVFTNILLYFTVRMSQMREDIKKLAQEIAISRPQGGASGGASAAGQTAAKTDSGAGWVPGTARTVAGNRTGSRT